MQNKHPHSVIALLFAIALVPTASHLLVGSVLESNHDVRAGSSLKPWVTEDRRAYRAQKRAHKRERQHCLAEFQKTGVNKCADFNETDEYRHFAADDVRPDRRRVRTKGRRTTREEIAKLEEGLSPRDRSMLRQFRAIGRCPPLLQNEALKEKCKELVGYEERTPAIVGLINSKVYLNLKKRSQLTLWDRIGQMQNWGKRREDIKRPSTKRYYEKD